MAMSWPKTFLAQIYATIPFKQQVFEVLRTYIPLPERIYRHLHFKGVFTVHVDRTRNFRMRHHGYVIENEVFWGGLAGWEKVSLELWKRLCEGSRVILDIGANTGLYALLAQAVNPEAKVVAVEPVGRIFEKLSDNIHLNGERIRGVNAAISNYSGTAKLYDLPEKEHVLSVSLESDWNRDDPRLVPVEVPCYTVVDLLFAEGEEHVDLLKIDVETHEPHVLEGFRQILTKDRPSMLIEILNEDVARKVSHIIEGLDYVYFDIDDVTWPPRQVRSLGQSGHFNYLICRPEVAAAIGLAVPSE
jgi:FkbM family methyltransferase